ncbi:similar to Saccharomyces cerevisiae YGR104C SRB5 Subunit of the RNA polymerase II mediator complex [Maudiozyma barnettii]|uniref:Mediator of RNA polymerase II transcription subunit 18 n=1 Tax=Maudiozyma barnettii TaxID=61262 RepID=A0A8H2VAV9_9SACH|nr:Srb5p [Kazachstania barnettii]CAB4251883.1 similar to Saccharomyces cerevisiae YGR104C SRB5 Subunit of the RNA polymerase II mediator complex [Kazachstania barnettii]CAD1778187.1 similar to Saccharomyces cerevisiae YGR104C SRB5 Subunit of the RNA polymerase II mediator complex [Kazachstania barnettii]
MVQQLSLFSSIDDKSYDLFIATLTTLSGNPPILYSKLSTVWIPNPLYQIEGVNSKNQLVEKNRINVSKELPLEMLKEFSNTSDNATKYNHEILKKLQDDTIPIEYTDLQNMINEIKSTRSDDDVMDVDGDDIIKSNKKNKYAWCISISDIPAAGNNRKVSMQTINESILLSHVGVDSSLQKMMNELGYIYQYQYVTIGARFNLKHNLIVELQKIWSIGESSKQQKTKGGLLVKAFINIDKATDIDKMNMTETVLLNLQKELQGYVELAVPDRKSMDSRMDVD